MSTLERRVMACPSCGAALPPDAAGRAATCPFCGVTTEPALPPPAPVVQQVIREVVYVQGAPGTLHPEQQVTSTSRECPRCRAPMFETSVHGVALDGCGTCGGIWLDNAGTRAVMQHADPQLLDLADRAEKHATATPDRAPADLPCAQCKQPMQRIAVGETTLVLDVCVAHGTWFDAHELQVFSRAYTLPAAGKFWLRDPAQADAKARDDLVGLLGEMLDRTFDG
jgi:Zn-finger nucleic acid-binding protein